MGESTYSKVDLMKRQHHLSEQVQEALQEHRLLKVIAGLSNFDRTSVARISRAAALGGADLLDVACDPALVQLASESSGLSICASAVEPHLFPAAVKAGASMVEIGNYDSFYPKGRFFRAEEVLALTKETRSLLPDVVLSVTVPHILPLDKQAKLALDLVHEGADFIQTEGGTSSSPINAGVLGLIEKAAPTLAATHTITDALTKAKLNNQVICASGLSSVTVPMAIAAGANGAGVGSAVNRLNDELAMIAEIRRLKEAICKFSDQLLRNHNY